MKNIEPHILVIFGASGDLTERKLIPSVFNLFSRGFLPENFAILGTGRTKMSDEEFQNKVANQNEFLISEKVNKEKVQEFSKLLHYEAMDSQKVEDYVRLKERMQSISGKCEDTENAIFYLSTPPFLYSVIPNLLAEVGLQDQTNGWKRLIIEKPFGYDLASAKELNESLLSCYSEDQIYRIDHYLGKETVQNMLVTRFSNSIFEPLWNRNYIHHVEITNAEKNGVGTRAGYYDSSGAMRDMFQNHLLQLLAFIAMEPPVKLTADDIRNEKLKLFQSIRPLSTEDIKKNVIRGQYVASTIKGEKVIGYREAEGVKEGSKTETYFAVKFFIDNWRWEGVPFYMRTGKALPTKVTEIVIHFKPTPQTLFNSGGDASQSNKLIIRIQPNEGILIKFGMKSPGEGFNVQTVNMDFHYDDLQDSYVAEAYERLLLDCMLGDATLYARGDSVEAAWGFVQPILDAWKNDDSIKVYGYPAGTWGPREAEQLVEQTGWRYPCKNLADDGEYCEL